MDAREPTDRARSGQRSEAIAVAALLLGTVFWGCGFTWAKAAGEAVQDAARLPRLSAFGPVFLLGWRFLIASVCWFAVFPAARRGWTWRGLGRALLVGLLLGGGLIVQHIGLDHTPEAVSAFLTSLTILFVPMLMMFIKPPQPVLWVGVALATAGVWAMTGAQPSGFGWGEVLGLSCAFLFSLYILTINAASIHETPWRLVGAQFGVVALMCFVTAAFQPRGLELLRPGQMLLILSVRTVWFNLALLSFFTTLVAFGLLTFYQPRIDPTRAALIYLAEPIFATAYAALFAGHRAGPMMLAGAALILVANVLVEVVNFHDRAARDKKIVLVD